MLLLLRSALRRQRLARFWISGGLDALLIVLLALQVEAANPLVGREGGMRRAVGKNATVATAHRAVLGVHGTALVLVAIPETAGGVCLGHRGLAAGRLCLRLRLRHK